MKKIIYAAMPIAAIAALSLNVISEPLPIGSALPEPTKKMKSTTGKEVSFNDVMGKNGLLVMFSCNTCPIVKKYDSRIIDVSKFALENNFGVILLNPNEAYRDNGDSYEDMKDYAKNLGYNWDYVLDNNSVMADLFGATRTPEVFLFDNTNSKNTLVYHGAIDDNQNGPDVVTRMHLLIAMKELMNGKEITTKKTRSVGCTIKRVK
jgi:hypothetical protein